METFVGPTEQAEKGRFGGHKQVLEEVFVDYGAWLPPVVFGSACVHLCVLYGAVACLAYG